MDTYLELTPAEQQDFLKFPVYVALLAANADGTTDDQEKSTAIAFEHTKTYTADPLLGDFYEHSVRLFRQTWQELDNELPKGKEQRDQVLKQRLSGTEKLLGGFSKKYQTPCISVCRPLRTTSPGRITMCWRTLFSRYPSAV